jgi:hypothetical protein
MVIRAYLNRLAVAVPEHEVHDTFVRFAERAACWTKEFSGRRRPMAPT